MVRKGTSKRRKQASIEGALEGLQRVISSLQDLIDAAPGDVLFEVFVEAKIRPMFSTLLNVEEALEALLEKA